MSKCSFDGETVDDLQTFLEQFDDNDHVFIQIELEQHEDDPDLTCIRAWLEITPEGEDNDSETAGRLSTREGD